MREGKKERDRGRHCKKERGRSKLGMSAFSLLVSMGCILNIYIYGGWREGGREEGREGEREKQAERSPSRLCATSTEPDAGLKLTKCKIMT